MSFSIDAFAWTRIGPERPKVLEEPKFRPKSQAKKKKILTTNQRLEKDERFNDITRRINKHNKWKRLKNIGRIEGR